MKIRFYKYPSPARRIARVLAAGAVLSLVACAPMPATHTGFLSNGSALRYSEDGSTGYHRSGPSIDPRQVLSFTVEWAAPDTPRFSADEKVQLESTLRNALTTQLHALPAKAGGRAVLLRAAVTRVEAVSPALNTVATVLLFGPLDRGGAAVEVELVDAETGRPLASYARAYFAPLSEFKARFSRLAPATWALEKSAAEFAQWVHSGV